MNRKLAIVTGAALLGLVAAVAIPAATAVAEGALAAADPGGASADIVSALQRDLKLSADQVRVRLSNEAKASRTELRLRKELGSAFGGAYLSADATVFTVAVTTDAAAAAVRREGATPRIVSRSERGLEAVKNRLDGTSAPRAVAGWYVDAYTNAVVVVANTAAAGQAFVASSGVQASAVRVQVSDESPRPLIDVIGGNAYFIGGGRCSVGFSVNGGFVTAGHCGTTGSGTTQPSGQFAGSTFPGSGDYAWVRVNTGNTMRPWVNQYNGTNVTVAGSQEAAVGASVCRSGSTTGWHCNLIQAKNQTVNYPQGSVTGLTRTNVCAEPGDSGGSWLSGTQAQGVTSGGSGNCTSGGTTYFQPVNEILSAYGLTLLTGGGGGTTPPPPPPGNCSGYPNVYTGTLSSGQSQYQPNGSYFYESSSGTHRGCLDAASSTVDFDLYLQKWNGSAWVNVASGTTTAPDEQFSYNGTPGYYRYRVHAYSGSASYTLGIDAP